jgi:hypothetical protein
MMVVNH